MRYLLFFLSLLFVFFSFSPSLYEISQKHLIPATRTFTLEHNYLFDYNFYLSRIREGQEGNWLVSEKYYNQPHNPSLFQVFYLYLGKLGGIFGAAPPEIYHAARLVLGFTLLYFAGRYALTLLPLKWALAGFLFLVTLGSWPIPVQVGESWRFATYMGWWSVSDSLQRITTIPHVLFGQIMLLVFIWVYSRCHCEERSDEAISRVASKGIASPAMPDRNDSIRWIIWGMLGLVTGIVFPPTLIIVYFYFAVLSILEGFNLLSPGDKGTLVVINKAKSRVWLKDLILPRTIFGILTLPSLVYMQLSFRELPWSALPLFDIEHRIPLPFKEYILSLGPVFFPGLLGLAIVLIKREKKLYPAVSWVAALFLLFKIFEYVPQQSPLRFTEGLINVPLGILAAFFFYSLWIKLDRLVKFAKLAKGILIGVMIGVVVTGLLVMLSMVGWLTDQVRWRREGTWKVAIGAQLIYPLNDFMDAVRFLKLNTKISDVVLGYVTAGNFIPAYGGNYVYLGHANTPRENDKEKIAANFFAGKMKENETRQFLSKERISYIFFGPQERDLGGIVDLKAVYPFISEVYTNREVVIYKVNII